MERRRETWREAETPDGSVLMRVRRWQEAVHTPGMYDVAVDTSSLSPAECASTIRQRLEKGPAPSALQRLAVFSSGEAYRRT
jgi:chloramphenicol 3-O phosphotransferase